jgi:hypothetical protein
MRIAIENARLSFPHVFTPTTFSGKPGEIPKFEATFLMDKVMHKDVIKEIEDGIEVLTEKELKGQALAPDRICLKDGDNTKRPENQGMMVIKASSQTRVPVLNNDVKRTPLVAEDGKPYPGCRINGFISLWVQDNGFGKRINAGLDGVQFAGDDEPFSGSVKLEEDAFDVFATEEEF